MWLGLFFVYVDMVYGFYGYSFLCLVGCFSMITWTPTVLSVLYAGVSYFCICTCSAQFSMCHMERRSRNTLIIIIIIIIMLIGTIDFIHFMQLSMILTLAHKVGAKQNLLAAFSCTLFN